MPDHPGRSDQPIGRHTRIRLGRHNPPPRPWTRPRSTRGQLLWSDLQWRPVTILWWHRLAEPAREMMSGTDVEWLVCLETSEGPKWYGYQRSHLRPG